MTVLALLEDIRHNAGPRRTRGIPDDRIVALAGEFPELVEAIELAAQAHARLRSGPQVPLLQLDEDVLCQTVQQGFVNFYKPEAVNPYVGLAARGPWIVTTHGAVVHDNGGYGMLGQGHNPPAVLAAMGAPRVMANVMTPSLSHLAFDNAMRAELGRTRDGGCPFARFICLNSGSESMSVAMRLADVNARRLTSDGAPHQGRTIKRLAIQGGFHGRTGKPARISDSCREAYEQHLASFRDHSDLVTVPQNDLDALRAAFDQAAEKGWFFEALYMEPVQGEGAPGKAITREFYDLAEELIHGMGGLLVIDSIQAGLRARGVLSLVDYPDFQDAVPPDIETWSKALNAGQYPLSVLGLSGHAAELYVHGIYGNTMTTNPRALEVAVAVLGSITDELRDNIRDRGLDFLDGLRALDADYPGIITSIQGTGLLFAAEIRRDLPVVGFGAIEEQCRRLGLGVVHGGNNALRFTPHFGISRTEVDLILALLREVFAELHASLAA